MGISQSYVSKDCTRSTSRGRLTGITVSEKATGLPVYERFTRIRYALPPAGEWRWRRPRSLTTDWTFDDGDTNGTPKDCRTFGPICHQIAAGTIVLDNPTRTEIIQNDMNEDCLYLNIWVPIGVAKPREGFPVLLDIPGGRHQCGHGMQQDFFDPADKMRETRDTPHIIVSFNARVGIFGFLSIDGDVEGNFGFWDVRMALEWVHANIALFGGNSRSITAGGLGPATLYQLHYDISQPAGKQIIRRVIFMGDVPLVQPTSASHPLRKQQLHILLQKLGIDEEPADLLPVLKSKGADSIMDAVRTLDFGFTPVTDDDFVSSTLLRSVWDGTLGTKLKQAGVKVLIGDTSEERNLYAVFAKRSEARFRFSNSIDSYDALVAKLKKTVCPDEDVVHAILEAYQASNDYDWTQIYCDVMADTQTHAAVRCLVGGLFEGGMTTRDVLRYQTAWRPKCLDEWLPPATGVCHAVEIPIWWYCGWRAGFNNSDKDTARTFMSSVNRFIVGDTEAAADTWGTQTQYDVRRIGEDGSVTVVEDKMWAHQSRIWQAVRRCQTRVGLLLGDSASG